MIHWFVAHTRYGAEERTASRLPPDTFETYVPKFKKRYTGEKRNYYEPRVLFPTYPFVRFDPNQSGWHDALALAGIRWLLGDSEGPIPLRDREIASLKARENKGFVDTGEPAEFQRGDRVKLRNGSIVDILGRVQYMDERGRVSVLVEMFGRATVALIPSRRLEPADNQMTVKFRNSPAISPSRCRSNGRASPL